jgi:peptidyl-prolyl cis-trans isomerase SurA
MRQTLIAFLTATLSFAADAQVLDRVVAVVDNDLILESDLNAQIQFYISNNKTDPKTPGLKEQVLQSMIHEKLLVAKAIEDSVTVTDDEVQQQLDAVIQQRIQQVGSEARLEELYAMPLSKIKREFRDEMRKNLLSQKLQQQRFSNSQISRRDVEDFFQTYKDSLGMIPEEVELAHIAVKRRPGETAKAAARVKAQVLLDSLKAGVDFKDLAQRHSEDPATAVHGGDLGLVRRGQFVKEFETAVFSLNEQQISGIVESQFGFHIIQLLERRGDAVHPRHILIRVERTKADDDSVIAFLDSLRVRALAGENFAELARMYSEEKESAILGGSLGTSALEQVDKALYPTIVNLKQGEISGPAQLAVPGFDGFHIVLMKKRTPTHQASLDQDYHRIETIASNFKRNKEYAAWIEEIKSKIYWQSRLQ